MFTQQGRDTWADLLDTGQEERARRLDRLRGEERRQAEHLLALHARLESALRPVEPEPDFVKRLGARLGTRLRSRRRDPLAWLTPGQRWAIAAATVGAAASVAGVVAWMRHERSKQAQPAPPH